MTNLTAHKLETDKLLDELQRAQNQLIQSEKLAAIGQLAAGVAHEINNPIGYVNSNISAMERYITDLLKIISAYEEVESNKLIDEGAARNIHALKEELELNYIRNDIIDLISESKEGIERVKGIVNDLKDFSHVDEEEWQWADLHRGLDATLNIVRNEVKYKAEVVKEYGDLPDIECIPSQLNQVFMNMLVNAAQAIEERGVITLRTMTIDEQWVCVEISDTGAGIKAENLNRLFESFFTTKPVGQGTGLGLSLSYEIVKKHAGHIEVVSEVGKGSTFSITLPIRKNDAIAKNL